MTDGKASPETKRTDLAQLLCREARKTLEKAQRDLDGEPHQAALAKGYIFETVGYFEAAAAAYGEAAANDSKLAEARAREALSHLKAGHAERGLELATSVAATNKDLQLQTLATAETFSIMTILGDALLANNRLNDAAEAYKIARTVNPNDNYATAHLAEIYLATNRRDLAAELGSSITSPSRFEGLKTVLGLGNTNLALLPSGQAVSLVANVRFMMPGRPMDVHGEQRVAPLVDSRDEWCADVVG